MANKDRSRLVVSFQAEEAVVSWVDKRSENKGLSRSVFLGLCFEPILQMYVEDDSTLKKSVCSDENIKNKITSQLSFRASSVLIDRVDAAAEKQGLSRSAFLGLLFSAASRDTTFNDSTHKNVVVRNKNKEAKVNPPGGGIVKPPPVPFKAAVKRATAAAGFKEEEKEPGDKEDSIFLWILKGLAWVGGAYVVIALALSGKALGGSAGKGSGGPAAFRPF